MIRNFWSDRQVSSKSPITKKAC